MKPSDEYQLFHSGNLDHLPDYSRKASQQGSEICFKLIDCDYEIATSLIRLFGVTLDGQSIQATILDYNPYFYISLPTNLSPEDDSDIDLFRVQFNQYLNLCGISSQEDAINKILLTEKENVRNFKGSKPRLQQYLRIDCNSIQVMKKIVSIIEKGVCFNGFELPKQTFESKISYPLKFMIDYNLRGMGLTKLKNLPPSCDDTNCSLSYKISCSCVESVESIEEATQLRIISIDIQTTGQDALTFDNDTELLLISCTLHVSHTEIKQSLVLTQKHCEQINNVQIYSNLNETQILQKFHQIFLQWDPDIITSYNLHNEVFPFIMHRSKILGLSQLYLNYGRPKAEESIVTQCRFFSTVMRLRETRNVLLSGRVQIDTLICMLRDTKISQYSLGSIYYSIFNKQLEHYEQETILQLFSNNNLKRIANYSLAKAEACLEILKYKGWLVNYSEISTTTGVPINYIIMRGQSVKVLSQLLRLTKQLQFILPDENNTRKSKTSNLQGALVLPPQKGFYREPLALFDFVSLYPSIVIAYNMCYTTIIQGDNIQMDENDYFTIPSTQVRFVKQHIRKGILPLILEDLLSRRGRTKMQLNKESDPVQRALLDARQQALKIAANSIFGFTGCAEHGYLPCLEITSSILKVGRVILQNAIQIIQKNYPQAIILYGDTDSLLVNLGIESIQETECLAIQVASLVSSQFLSPIKLSLDKLFSPFLLVCKKRYVGLSWKNGQQIDKIEHKGICTVRRDNCLFLKKVLNEVLHQILIEQNFSNAVNIVKQRIQSLINGEISISNLIITKSLSVSIKEKNQVLDDEDLRYHESFHSYPDKYHDHQDIKQPHLKVAKDKIKNKQVSNYYKGDRIAYVIVDDISNNKLSENAEDPVEALSKQLPINIQYYVNQLKLPIINIFEQLIPNPQALFILSNYQCKQPKLLRQDKRQLNVKIKMMDKYFRKRNFCINCNEEIPLQKIMCYNCRENRVSILTKISQELCMSQHKFNKYGIICLQCQQSSFDEILCRNQECHIYYKRQEYQLKLNNVWDKYEKVYYQDW